MNNLPSLFPRLCGSLLVLCLAGLPTTYGSTGEPPTVTTPTSANIADTSATLGGNLVDTGGGLLMEIGVVYAATTANSNPQIGGNGVTKVAASVATPGVFTTAVTGLTANTGYTYAAYATNSVGTSYSATDMFTTAAIPEVTSVTGPANGSYKVGDTLTFTVNFSIAVNVTGIPRLALTVGSTTRYATYDAIVSTTTALKFIYTIQAGENDADGVAVASPLELNGSMIKAQSDDTDATLTFTPPTTTSVLVDNTVPTVTTIARQLPAEPETAATRLMYRVQFGESVTGVDAGDFALTKTGSADGTISSVINTSGSIYYVVVTGATGLGTLRLDVAAEATITDTAGNSLSGGYTGGQNYKRVVPAEAFAWGKGDSGQLGDGLATGKNVPVAVSTAGALAGKTIVALAAGSMHSLALSADGRVFGWGANGKGQLAKGDFGSGTETSTPAAAVTTGGLAGKTLVAVAAGELHSLMLDAQGKVYAAGREDEGQLGHGGSGSTGDAVAVDDSGALAGKWIVAIAAGNVHSLALASDGTVYAWGANDSGQLGDGTTTNRSTPVAVSTSGALAGKRIVAIAAGESHSLALASDGTVCSWGSNANGQLGEGGSLNQSTTPVALFASTAASGKTIIAIAAGGAHGLALASDGTILAWGHGDNGQLGDGNSYDRAGAVAVSTDGILQGKTIVALAAGSRHSLALASDGAIYGWGSGVDGALGNNGSTDSNLPVAVTASGALANRRVAFLGAASVGSHSLAGAYLTAPTISSVSAPLDAAYKAGDALTFTVNVSDAVTITGAPRLALTIGSTTRYATYDANGSTATALKFNYTVQAGDTDDADGIAVASPLELDGGTIKAQSDSAEAILTFTAPTTTSVLVDNTAPTVGNVTSTKANGTYAADTAIAITVTFSEAVTVTGAPQLTLETGATDRVATYASGSGTNTLTFTYTVQTTDEAADLDYASTGALALNGGTIRDAAGNAAALTLAAPAAAGSLGANKALVIVPTPTIASVTPPTGGTYAAGQQLNFTVTYTLPVTVSNSAGTPALTLSIGGSRRYAYYVSGTGTAALVFRYTVTAADNDGDGIAVSANSVSLNEGTIRSSVSIDAATSFTAPDTSGVLVDTPPIATAIRRLSPLTTATAAGAVTWRVSFSEPVTGVDAADFTLVKTHAAHGVIGAVTAVSGTDGAEYDVAVSSVSGNGTLRLDLNATGTGIADAGSAAISGGFTSGQFYAPLTASFPVGWGRNVYGRLGDGSSTERNTPSAVKTDGQLAGKYLVDLAAGGYFSLGLTADGKVYAWGYNADGELGLGTTTNWLSPQPVKTDGVLAGKTIVAIAAGGYHSLALDSAGKLYAWGKNDQGQLGNGGNTDSLVPVAVDMTGALAGKTVVAIAAGAEFSMALTSDGRVYTWGDGGDGQLGHSDYVDYSNVPVAVSTGGALAGKTVIALAAGSEHALALTTEGRAYAWGNNGFGQLGTNMFGTNRSAPNPVYHGGAYGTKTIVAIAAGWDHSIALTSEGRIYVWGENDHGQIGNNGTNNRNDPGLTTNTGALAGKSIIAVTGGDSHTTALDADGKVYNWGFNDYGQLGNGTSDTDTLLPVAVDVTGALAGKTVVSLGTNWGGVFNLALGFTTTGPRVVSVAPPASRIHRAGEHLDFSVTFNNPVTVVTAGGTPKFTVTIGATARDAVYVSGSGTDTLVFRYTVQAGELDTDGVAPGAAITLEGGTIKDAATLDATLTLATADTTGVIVDTRPAPTTLAPADNATGIAPTANLVLTFNEAVTAVTGKNLVIKSAADDSVVATIAVDDTARVTVDGATATVNPAANLLYTASYYVELDAGAFVNATTTGSAAIAGATPWNFSTESRSEVTAADSAEFAAYFANANVSTINLAAATTYTFAGGEVARTLTIHGNGATLQAGAGITDNVIRTGTVGGVTFSGLSDYTNRQVFLKVSGSFTIDHVTLQNNGANAASVGLFTVINVKNGGSLVADALTLQDFHNNPTPGTNLCFGLHAEPLAGTVTLTNSTIAASNAFRNAVAIRGGTVTATGNTFTGTEYSARLKNDDGYEYAFYLYGGSGTVSDNTITGYDATTQAGYASAAIAVIGFYSASYTIEDNTLSGNSIGIDVTRQWTGFTSPAPTVTVNGTTLVTSDDAYAIGEKLRADNGEERVSVSLDQNDEVQLTPPAPAAQYFAVLGGYRSPFLTATDITGTGATLNFPSTEADVLNAATSIGLETQKDDETSWTTVTPTWNGVPDSVAVTFTPGHTYRYRAKLTHDSYVESGDPILRNLVTYSALVSIDAGVPAITSALTHSGTYGGALDAYATTASKTPTSYNATGLPTGLSIDTGTGAITGTPTQTGTFNVTLTATNSSGTGSPATLVLTIAKAPLTVTANDASRPYGSSNPGFSVNYSGFRGGDTAAMLTTAPTATSAATVVSSPGTYAITPAGGASENYSFTYVSGTLTVTAATQTISFAAPADVLIGQSATLSATASSGLPVSFSVISGPASLSGATLSTTGVGTVVVRASQAGSGNYGAAPNVDRSFNVTVGSATVTTPTQVPTPPVGGTAELVVTNSNPNLNYQWQRNGSALPSATGTSLTLPDVQPPVAGLYTYTATVPGGGGGTSEPVIVGLTTSEPVIGTADQVGADIVHPNGNVYDQVLLEGNGAAVKASTNKTTRVSFVDLTNDIVQVEFSGAGTLSVVMDDASSPAPPINYNQENVDYVRGHVGLVITGANETSNLSVFSVGPVTAVNQSLFKEGVTYDGVADIAFVAIQSTNGKFGGIRTGNVSYYASQGFTGVYAPGVAFAGPVNIGEVSAFDSATPVLVFGSVDTVSITGGNLDQANSQSVKVSGITQLRCVDGTTSQGTTLPAQQNRGVLVEDGVNVTDLLVVNP